MSDYANLFAHLYKQRKGLSSIENSEDAPVSLELIIFAFGELGKPDFSDLIGKVQKFLIEDKELYETAKTIRSNTNWMIKRIPKHLLDDSEIETDMTAFSSNNNEIINGQYLHLAHFLMKLDKALAKDSHLVMSSPLYQINNELADIETKIYNVSTRIDSTRCFRRIYQEDQVARAEKAKVLEKSK